MSVFTVLERLTPHIEREVNLIMNSKQEAETLKGKLERIQEWLQDAEKQGVTDLNVKRWLRDLEDVMYQMDDALDKWETKNLELQIEQSEFDHVSDPWEQVRSLFCSLCLSFKHLVGRRGLTLEMKALSARLDEILEKKGLYSFDLNTSDNSRELEKPETTSSVDESQVYGRKADKDSLVELLLSKGEQQSHAQVISIVGVGGLGKTTLAQLVFNDPRVKDHFDLRAWVSVLDPFDASKVAKAIVEAFGKSSSGNSTLESLGQQIKEIVPGKKFLLVLDNIWTVDRAKWKSLSNFLVDEPGCRILVTTRDELAGRAMGTTHWRRLNLLSDSDCATILKAIALEGRSEEEGENFYEVGSRIAEKCNGLPLAAMTIGNMLASRFRVEEWRDVLESPLWKYEDEMDEVFRPLRLSYMDLSPILKRCFLSSVLYPKGFGFGVGDLIKIWIAQGYIGWSKKSDEVYSKGIQYFRKLLTRSFFQVVLLDKNVEGGIICKLHDVMHEFAIHLSRSEHYFILDRTNHATPINPRTRYFSAIGAVSREYLPPNLLRLLQSVRVLCLRDSGLKELSEEVGKLIHLRFLDLGQNPITQLPETLTDLYNLQTLSLEKCETLSSLPQGIEKLMKLRHLLTLDTPRLEHYPKGLEQLTHLQTLQEFKATRDSAGYLGNLNELTGFLKIDVKDMNEAAEAEKANLSKKDKITQLLLNFSDNVSGDVIEAMAPPPQLQLLYVVEGNEPVLRLPFLMSEATESNHWLPNWITSAPSISSFSNLKDLLLQGFRGDSSYNLPPALAKLPMLESLQISNMNFKRATLEFLGIFIPEGAKTAAAVGGFPKLRKLNFSFCDDWEEWEDIEEEVEAAAEFIPVTMPCLEELIMFFCDGLKALPHRLLRRVAPSLQKLNIQQARFLEGRYHKRLGPDRDKISHIPYIFIYGITTRLMDRQ